MPANPIDALKLNQNEKKDLDFLVGNINNFLKQKSRHIKCANYELDKQEIEILKNRTLESALKIKYVQAGWGVHFVHGAKYDKKTENYSPQWFIEFWKPI